MNLGVKDYNSLSVLFLPPFGVGRCHIAYIRNFREWKCITKKGPRMWDRNDKKELRILGERGIASLLMPRETQGEYEGVKPRNIVRSPGQSTKAISSRAPNHFWRRNEMWLRIGSSEMEWSYIQYLFLSSRDMHCWDLEGMKIWDLIAGPQLSRCLGPRNTRQGELVRMLVTVSNLFDK